MPRFPLGPPFFHVHPANGCAPPGRTTPLRCTPRPPTCRASSPPSWPRAPTRAPSTRWVAGQTALRRRGFFFFFCCRANRQFLYTALHVAAQHTVDAATITALVAAGANIEAKTPVRWPLSLLPCRNEVFFGGAQRGETPLHMAAMFDRTETAHALLANGASLAARDNVRPALGDYACGKGAHPPGACSAGRRHCTMPCVATPLK